MIVLAVATNGRRDCMERTIPSLLEHVHGPITRRVILDDSGDPEYVKWLSAQFARWTSPLGADGFEIQCAPNAPSGYDRAYRWRMDFIAKCSERFCFLHEDDFLYHDDVPLASWIEVFTLRHRLLQISLKRQAWFPLELEAGGIVEANPDAFTDTEMDGWPMTTHRAYWTFNPSLFRIITAQATRFPLGPRSEWRFHVELLRRSRVRSGPSSSDYYAIAGAKFDPPRVTHIGDERLGKTY